MRLIVLIPLALIIVSTGWAVITFNRLVRGRNQLKEGWSGIDVQLKRRRDLVPNLVAVVKAYQKHEQELLENVTRHRSEAAAASTIDSTRSAEGQLSADLGRLLMLAESYPDLKADSQFRELGSNLVKIEDDLQYARRYYNGSVRDLNNLVESFPNNLIAAIGGFKTADYFELENAAAGLTPDLGKLLSSTTSESETA
ncbi:MAG: LemA family protein [Verrucomicrobiales bacterium]|nr:LemA family protein [Verrucomicrobiales bacterium]